MLRRLLREVSQKYGRSLFEGRDVDHMLWVVKFVSTIAEQVLLCSLDLQKGLVCELTSKWSSQMLEKWVAVVVSVADASVVHIEDNVEETLSDGTNFWFLIGFLHILHAANRQQNPVELS